MTCVVVAVGSIGCALAAVWRVFIFSINYSHAVKLFADRFP